MVYQNGTVVGYTEPNGSQGVGIVEGFFSGMYLIKVTDGDDDDERIIEAEEGEVEQLHLNMGWE
ncbi:hypothetical protein TWF730_007427 [Orbilia blumenaviensis]|uniref:Uncharacterized protein n=1 Tax=Orbilia blumenaviensis TaxID=1796055 RepID=A0AAV9VBK0_9PEZI